ncbi:hypothetical protein R7Z80_01675 [Vibrio sp. 1733]|uniref:hypothetical protein n=1 Tax=Vibrio TaxID=662 RepID=UPI002964638B|nr:MULTISPECIES: hypothetical protein [unclassified Vibrio]MDW2184559.1 hypothetical protein [Vibrio sp. 1733]MDW2234295.1 hypothetical protein [Vibrio sp. 1565-1]
MKVITNNIKPERIANAICQDKSFKGHHILLEGIKDIKVYSKFINKEKSNLVVCHGKYNQRGIFQVLCERKITKKIAIRDADFIRLRGNLQADFHSDFFITDKHDSEGMIISTPAFFNSLSATLPAEKLARLLEEHKDLESKLKSLVYNLGCLKLANKIYSLGLVFKPKSADGNPLDLTKFIDFKNLSYQGNNLLIKAVINYSVNKVDKGTIKDEATIRNALEEIINTQHPVDEIVHGHDISLALCHFVKKGLKVSNVPNLSTADSIESLWASSFDNDFFRNTELYQSLTNWCEANNIEILTV